MTLELKMKHTLSFVTLAVAAKSEKAKDQRMLSMVITWLLYSQKELHNSLQEG